MNPRRYRKRQDKPVLAIRLELDMPGFDYHKWGDTQFCKSGDWLVDNDGDIYTVDRQVFAETYHQTGPATFVKHAPVWARRVSEAGSVKTREGRSHYQAGDYVVSNHENGGDAWCIEARKFEDMYQPDE